ncbi:MAG: molybdate ABC transporter substrate-binding protein [Rhodospirillaceae bacterium]|nr:MAG: molybdate ABC transporter substrate-binding protein [Rhodospirillaceae bacterium]
MARRFALRWIAVLAAWLVAAPLSYAADATASDQVLVFAASSLTEALTEVGEAYAKAGNSKPVFSFGASSALARQIENGAPATLFVSADEQWMDYLADKKLIVPDSRKSFLGNTLVLVAPVDQPLHIAIGFNFPLAKALGTGKLSMGDPDSVPVGKYGKAALENLGVWRDVEANVIRADNVRAALAFVERGEAAAGIVYATDAALTNKVTVVGAFPELSYPVISYPLAIVANHDTPAARAFRDFMLGNMAKVTFAKYGFRVN